MEDIKIVQLYTERSERAIAETSVKYGAYLNKIAYNILRDFSDTEECVSDTYMNIWKWTISGFKSRIVRTFRKIKKLYQIVKSKQMNLFS